jgi:hypothetical protein
MFKAVTFVSHSGSVAVPSYQSSLFLVTIRNFLNKIGEIMDPTMENKANGKT